MRISDWSSDVCSSDPKVQNDIITDLRVDSVFDAGREIERRVTFLADYLISSGARALVLGISGGVDSLVGGCLSQRAVERVRKQGGAATFVRSEERRVGKECVSTCRSRW